MKKSSFQRLSVTSAHRVLRLRAGVGVLAIIVLIVLVRVVFPQALTALATPLWHTGTYLTGAVGFIPVAFTDKIALTQTNQTLIEHSRTLERENATLKGQVHDLEKLLGTRTERSNALLAGVMVRPPVIAYDTLIIDSGTNQRITPHALVMGPGGVPIGTIDAVSPTSSTVTLFSTPGKETLGWVGESKSPVTFVGTGAGSMRATVSKEVAVAVGDVVYTSGPGAIAFGTVGRVDTNASSPQATLHITLYTNPFSLTWVTVSQQ